MACRAPSFASGATASARSRKTWSAGSPCAFSRKRGLLPGTARQDRRGRAVPGAAAEVDTTTPDEGLARDQLALRLPASHIVRQVTCTTPATSHDEGQPGE